MHFEFDSIQEALCRCWSNSQHQGFPNLLQIWPCAANQ